MSEGILFAFIINSPPLKSTSDLIKKFGREPGPDDPLFFDPDAKEFGFTEEKVRSDVVSKLEAADIEVLSYNACCETPGAPYLFVGIGILRDNTCERWAATVHIELRQLVNLEREPDVSYHATTWIRGETIFVDNQNAVSEIQNLLEGWIGMFTYDFSLTNK